MDNIQKEMNREEATKLLEELEAKGLMNVTEELIKDNRISFEVKGMKYRARLLNFREKEELDTLRRKKFGQLIQDKDLMLEKDLIKIYKERGIDISEYDEKIRKIESEMHDKKISLGESLANNHSETILKSYEEQITKLIAEKNVIYIQKSKLLEYSIECQLLNYVAELITYLSIETEDIEGKFKRLWNNIEEFKRCDNEELIDRAALLSTLLQYAI